jgi:hypothetical protein
LAKELGYNLSLKVPFYCHLPITFGNSTHSIASTYAARYHRCTACGFTPGNRANRPVITSRWKPGQARFRQVRRASAQERWIGSRRVQHPTQAQKVYGFDAGFVCTQRGWSVPRPDDLGE